MERKICTHCNIEKNIEGFYNKYTYCKSCKSCRSLKRYYENKDNLSSQRKLYYERKRNKLIQKQKSRYTNYKELHRSYIEIQDKYKKLEENFKLNDSEKHQKFYD